MNRYATFSNLLLDSITEGNPRRWKNDEAVGYSGFVMEEEVPTASSSPSDYLLIACSSPADYLLIAG